MYSGTYKATKTVLYTYQMSELKYTVTKQQNGTD